MLPNTSSDDNSCSLVYLNSSKFISVSEAKAVACPVKTNGVQGREKDVAIFSTVRDGKRGSIGFTADERRVNVGLTRARSSLIVIGNAKALKTDERWANLVRQAMTDGCVKLAILLLLMSHACYVMHRFRAACLQVIWLRSNFVTSTSVLKL